MFGTTIVEEIVQYSKKYWNFGWPPFSFSSPAFKNHKKRFKQPREKLSSYRHFFSACQGEGEGGKREAKDVLNICTSDRMKITLAVET